MTEVGSISRLHCDRYHRRSLAAAVAFVLVASPSLAQPSTHVIDARSRQIQIIDGDDVLAGVLVDSADPDTYVYHPSPGPKRVSYLTDAGRADFDVAPGETRDFAIRYRGRLYRQRLTGSDPTQSVYTGAAQHPGGFDSIPLRLGPNNAIHLQASLNRSPPLDLIFDTGASIAVLSESGAVKGARLLAGNRNVLRLGSVTVARTPVKFIDFGGKAKTDGVIGFNAFLGKVVEIDYDRRVLRLSSNLPVRSSGYRKVAFVWRGMNSLVPLTIQTDGKSRQVLALFDTGSKWSLSLNNRDSLATEGLSGLPVLGRRTGVKADGSRVASTVVTLPNVGIAGFSFPAVQADVERRGGTPALAYNIVGNDFLKRFNLIIDYGRGEVYLKPNRLAREPYNRVIDPALILYAAIIASAIAAVAGIWWYRQRRRRSCPPSASLGRGCGEQ